MKRHNQKCWESNFDVFTTPSKMQGGEMQGKHSCSGINVGSRGIVESTKSGLHISSRVHHHKGAG
jgi:hypothetical protein